MQGLSDVQYESVLGYMQQYNENSFQIAESILKLHNYDMNTFKEYMRGLEIQEEGEREGELENLEGNYDQDQLLEQDDIVQMNRMRIFIDKSRFNKKVSNSEKFTNCIKNICLKITESLLPEVVKTKIIRSRFYQIYQQEAVIELKNKDLGSALKAGKESMKNILLIVSENGKNHCLIEFLKKKKLLQKISIQYEIVGVIDTELKDRKNTKAQSITQLEEVSTNANSEIVQSSIFEDIHPPSVIVLRQKHTQELSIIETYFGEQQILSFKQETLNGLRQKIKGHTNKQASMLKRLTGQKFKKPRANMAHASKIFVEKNIRAQQNKEYSAMESKIKKQKQQRNKKYEEIEQLLEQRNCRKLSLPKQPIDEGEQKQMIKIIFRCPNGQNITRNFTKKQKCEILFLWVDLNDDIQFEMDDNEENRIAKEFQGNRKGSQQKVIVKQRKFDLMYSYPPESLKSKIDMQIGDIFDEEEQVKILIKEE